MVCLINPLAIYLQAETDVRLPLVPVIDSRNGTTEKDALVRNLLKETDEGTELLCLRPGLVTISSNTGNGSGLTDLDGVLISVFGTTLGYGNTPASVGTVVAGTYDFAAGPL